MTEERIRFVCAQVVCSICDLTDDVQPEIVEAWIELMRYVVNPSFKLLPQLRVLSYGSASQFNTVILSLAF